jgi:hypothetical protein
MTRYELNQFEKNLVIRLRAEQIEAQELYVLTISRLKVRYEDGMKQAQEAYNATLNAALYTFERAV